MENIKLITEEDYINYMDYVCAILDQCGIDYPLAMIELDGKKYGIVRYDSEDTEELDDNKAYAIAYEEDGNILVNIVGYQESRFSYTDKDYSYCLGKDIVERMDPKIGLYESLSGIDHPSVETPYIYSYTQEYSKKKKKCLALFYPVEDLNNKSSCLYFLGSKIPSVVEYFEKKFKVYTASTNYVIVGDRYYEYKVEKSRQPATTSLSFSIDEMQDMIKENGFSNYAPKDMINILNGSDSKPKKLSRVLELYREKTGK